MEGKVKASLLGIFSIVHILHITGLPNIWPHYCSLGLYLLYKNHPEHTALKLQPFYLFTILRVKNVTKAWVDNSFAPHWFMKLHVR